VFLAFFSVSWWAYTIHILYLAFESEIISFTLPTDPDALPETLGWIDCTPVGKQSCLSRCRWSALPPGFSGAGFLGFGVGNGLYVLMIFLW
jgi:hypothetical protein